MGRIQSYFIQDTTMKHKKRRWITERKHVFRFPYSSPCLVDFRTKERNSEILTLPPCEARLTLSTDKLSCRSEMVQWNRIGRSSLRTLRETQQLLILSYLFRVSSKRFSITETWRMGMRVYVYFIWILHPTLTVFFLVLQTNILSCKSESLQ